MMKKVYICAPMTADTQRCIELAKTYATYALKCGTAPVVPHFYALCDGANPKGTVENAGRSLLWFCDELWVFGDQQTKAMKTEIHFCKNLNIPIRYIDPQKVAKFQEEMKNEENE